MANVVKPKGKFATIFFVVLTAYFALPIAFLFISATKAPDEFGTTNPFWFGEYLNFFQNIQGIFDSNEGIYLVWLKNSLIYSFSGALGALICSAMAYQRDTLGIHFTWKKDDAIYPIVEKVEAALRPFNYRPHWGKVFTADARYLNFVYPKMSEFTALITGLDPNSKFSNTFTKKVVG